MAAPPQLSGFAAELGVSARTLRRDIAWLGANGYDVRIDRGRVRYVRAKSDSIGDGAPPSTSFGRGFVGRSEELDAALEDLTLAAAGNPRILVVSGEAGVGKTSFVDQITDIVASRGFVVAGGRATLDDGAPGFWPLKQVIRSLTDHHKKGGPGDISKAGTELVSELMPDSASPGRGRPSNDHELHAIRFGIFDAVARFLSDSAAVNPIVLAIDDMQWADSGTLDMVRHLSNSLDHGQILMAVTIRDGEANDAGQLRRTLAELAHRRGHRRIALSGLAKDGVARLVENRTRQPGHPAVIDYVDAHTGGNPFFVRELVEHLISHGFMDAGNIEDLNALRVPVPESVQDILEARLRSLSSDTVMF